MGASTINLQALIAQQAIANGVPPAIALAVAQKESSTSQWTPSGNLVTGSSGEIGVFQLMPGTAAALGVDPTDINQNISGGINYLSQLFAKYGNWTAALSAYNSGSPTGSLGYATSVLSMAGTMPDVSGDSSAAADGASGVPLTLVAGAALGGLALVLWAVS